MSSWDDINKNLQRMKMDTVIDLVSKNIYNTPGAGSTNSLHSTYDNPLILADITNINSAEHRWARAQYCPLYNTWIMRKNEEIFHSGFEYYDKEASDFPMIEDWIKRQQRRWDRYRIHESFKRFADKVDGHGWAFICRVQIKGEVAFRTISNVTIRNPQISRVPTHVGDILLSKDDGLPKQIRIPRYKHDYRGKLITEDDFQFVSMDTTEEDPVFGQPFHEKKSTWNISIDFTETRRSQKNFLVYWALIPAARVPMSYKDAEVSATKDELKRVRLGNYVVVLRGNKDQVDFDMKGGAANMLDFPTNIESIIRDFSGPTGYPYRYFVGDPNGALSAASEDGLKVIQEHEAYFKRWVPHIKEFNERFITNA